MRRFSKKAVFAVAALATMAAVESVSLGGVGAPHVTFLPYVQPGDAAELGANEQMLVAWQTDETAPDSGAYRVEYGLEHGERRSVTPAGRVVDNYLTADPQFASVSIPTAYGAHTNYSAVLTGLRPDTTYFYRVTGPGLPNGKFEASFHTRKQGNTFSFEVMGDEGFYPFIPGSNLIANFEARVIRSMYHVQDLHLAGQPQLPAPDLALNTGDNVYTVGSDANYRDWWMDVWNSNQDTNDDGAPFLRHIPLYIVVGNHDCGATGASANLLADDPPTVPGSSGPGRFGGGVSGGDALAHFNNFYFPLNGPLGADIQSIFNGDTVSPTGMFFKYQGTTYTSSAAIEAYRASTAVDGGKGIKRQIDHMSNYSFDYGNAHFLFLDANPHLFNALLPGGNTYDAPPSFPFPSYPAILRNWVINDLDSSDKAWKIVVFHQPSFSSGNATLRNDQMRRIARLLENHGVNMVFNGHEHNYQRTLPLRALNGVDQTPSTSNPPVVAIDTNFDGVRNTVPDGVLYLVEGAGGNRDFDDNTPNPRGGGPGIDQDDAATGTFSPAPGKSFPNGPDSWLDTNLTNTAMTPFLPGAGSGPKITVKFKARVFSFADIVVNGNSLTLYQISEPLGTQNSGKFGTDIDGRPVNDPLPDTTIDPGTGQNVSSAGEGTSVLLDKFTVTKPDVSDAIRLSGSISSHKPHSGNVVYTIKVENRGGTALNGTQIVLTLPDGVEPSGTPDSTTVHGQNVIATIGRLAPGDVKSVVISASATGEAGNSGRARLTLRSATAQPVEAEIQAQGRDEK